MLTDQTQTEIISMTPAAVQAVRELLEKRDLSDFALRVFVSGGGCSGLQYGMALEENIRPQDTSCVFDGVQVVVDEVSINYLRGSTVDYIENEMGSGFKIDNPNAANLSGCCGSAQNTNDPNTQGAAGGCSGCY